LRIEDDSNELAKLSLFAVMDSSPRVSAHFIQRQLSKLDDVTPKRGQLPSSELKINARLKLKLPVFSSIPKLSTGSLDHLQRLKVITNAIQLIDEQSKQLHAHVTGKLFWAYLPLYF
jgi:hypothetical protein